VDVGEVRVPAAKHSQSGYTLITGEPVISENLRMETRFDVTETLRKYHVSSTISVKIAAGEQPMGVLAAFSRSPRKFTQDNIYFLQSVANVLTAAISRQRAEASVRSSSEQAEKANRAKSEFLSRMSHELRTPLNAILGFTQLLELEKSTPSQMESIEHISRAGRHLLSLINEVLDIARLEAGRLALHNEAIPVVAFLHDTVELIRPLAHRHNIQLCMERLAEAPNWHVLGDRQRLKQVLLNLLSNAVKYNRPNGSIRVHVRESLGRRLRISVTDTGFGIPADKIGRLFLPFERLGAEATEIEGTGIGLALSRGIVDALQGELGVESVEGTGSTFWVEIPITDVSHEPQATQIPQLPPTVQPGAKASTLLYIEDQDLNLRLVERILLHHPEYKLLSAMQGGLGLDLAREHHPDLILLDLNLPDIAGEEVLSRLKADPDMRDIPVIMVSADAMGTRIDQLMASGAANYLTKPYRVSEFLRVIRETLAKPE
jgi:signal transduction histidine kinase/CheY-like chemotaxis protein